MQLKRQQFFALSKMNFFYSPLPEQFSLLFISNYKFALYTSLALYPNAMALPSAKRISGGATNTLQSAVAQL